MNRTLDDNIRQAAALIAGARRVACLTGAGMSAESGVATFRGSDGLWYGRRPEDVATPEAFHRDPADVWDFYLARRRNAAKCLPNPGHDAMAALDALVPSCTVITQNVDGLHRRAGSKEVVELHGNLWIDRCSRNVGNECPENRVTLDDLFDCIPTCPKCHAMMRPGVIWFGEMLPMAAFASAETEASLCDVMIVAGTSAVVYPAAALPSYALNHGAKLIEINIERTPLSSLADCRLEGPSGKILPRVIDQMRRIKEGPTG